MRVSTRFFCGLFFGLLFFSLFSLDVSAATIKGSVYNVFLDVLDRAILTVNTVPEQTMVSQQGTYTFDVPHGEYTLLAAYDENGTMYISKEHLVITDDGVYVIDLILTPDFEDEPLLDTGIEQDFTPYDATPSSLGFTVSLVAILFFMLYLILNRRHFMRDEHDVMHQQPAQQPEPAAPVELSGDTEEDIQKLLAFIKEQGGRVTQKEIRKMFPLSEAKISLLIADMESRELVRKIKKGRSNIIVLR